MTNAIMKIPFQAIKTSLCALGLAACVAVQAAPTTTNQITNLKLVPRLTIQSVVGYNNQIQFSTNTRNWYILTDLVVKTPTYTYDDLTAPAGAQRYYRFLAWSNSEPGAVPGDMVPIPAGSFQMGNPDAAANTGPGHTVTVDGFLMDTKLVTYQLWTNVYRWATNGNVYQFAHAGSGKATNHPVQMVDWYDAVKWCNARSEREGKTPCYYTDASKVPATVYRTGTVVLAADHVNWAANGYRLPTEAEWERAARGDTNGLRFPWGNTISHAQANYYGNTSAGYPYDLGPNGFHSTFTSGSTPHTSPAGYFQANNFGLYDMAGNVSEWCWDWYSSTYYAESDNATNPLGPDPDTYRSTRGGSWRDLAAAVGCYSRDARKPNNRFNTLGFRCVRATE
jgi:formylglycine-generating enzyme